jgi:hypothetical protein
MDTKNEYMDGEFVEIGESGCFGSVKGFRATEMGRLYVVKRFEKIADAPSSLAQTHRTLFEIYTEQELRSARSKFSYLDKVRIKGTDEIRTIGCSYPDRDNDWHYYLDKKVLLEGRVGFEFGILSGVPEGMLEIVN